MKNRTIKNILAIAIMISIFFIYRLYFFEIFNYVEAVFYILIPTLALLLFNFAVRRITFFKPYFISKYNFFSTKVRKSKEFDLPKDILFEKLQEVVHSAGFKVKKADRDKGEIFAISSISWKSNGENIYLTLKENKDNTIVDFCSVCFFQVYDWGKNESNLNKLLLEFDNSLVI